MGITIHFTLSYKGTKQELKTILESLRNQFQELGVMETTAVETIERADLSVGYAKFEHKRFLECRLGTMMSYDKEVLLERNYEEKLAEIEKNANGITLTAEVDPGSEPFSILLGRFGESDEWHGRGFTKTCYARDFDKAHGLVVRMLELCRDAGLLESVHDEAGVWEG